MERVGELSDVWRHWLGEWLAGVSDDFPVVFYEDDGTDSPDEWMDYPHLAIRDAMGLHVKNAECRVWFVGVDGWADPRLLGWEAIDTLAVEGRRS